ncbi:hypothetical protein BDR26DRAFT_1013814 [Obelidium mucronatum]|nr:hypothetical protein BDR26DRAFT_1013814 [Obelidium mucronatum]
MDLKENDKKTPTTSNHAALAVALILTVTPQLLMATYTATISSLGTRMKTIEVKSNVNTTESDSDAGCHRIPCQYMDGALRTVPFLICLGRMRRGYIPIILDLKDPLSPHRNTLPTIALPAIALNDIEPLVEEPDLDAASCVPTPATLAPFRQGGKFAKRPQPVRSKTNARYTPYEKRSGMPDTPLLSRAPLHREVSSRTPTSVFADSKNFSTSYLALSKAVKIDNYVRPELKAKEAADFKIREARDLAQEASKKCKSATMRSVDLNVLLAEDVQEIVDCLLPSCSDTYLSALALRISVPIANKELDLLKLNCLPDLISHSFKLSTLWKFFQSSCSVLSAFIGQTVEQPLASTILSMLAYGRNKHNNYLQKHLGLIFRGESLSYNGFRILNKLGLSTSYWSSTRVLNKLDKFISDGIPSVWRPYSFLGVYDNVENYKTTKEKTGKSFSQNRLISRTMLGAVQVQYDNIELPTNIPLTPLSLLKPQSIMPSNKDIDFLSAHTRNILRSIAIETVPAFATLQRKVLHHSRITNQYTIIPMGLSNEKDMSASGATRICEFFMKRFGIPPGMSAELPMFGDVGTVVNIRSAQQRRSCDKEFGNDVDRLEPIKPSPSPFHVRMKYIEGCRRLFKYDNHLFGSIGYFGNGIDRYLNADKYDFYGMERIFLATGNVYGKALVKEAFDIISGENNRTVMGAGVEETCNEVVFLVERWLGSSCYEPVYSAENRKTNVEYVSSDENPSRNYILQLFKRFCWYKTYCSAIKFNDAIGIQSLHKVALPFFARFCKGYCHAIVSDLIELESCMSQRCSYIVKNNRVVNPSGYPYSHVAIDQAMEHLNGDFKKMLPSGACMSDTYTNRIAMTCGKIQGYRESFLEEFGMAHRAGKHSDVSLKDEQDAFLKDITDTKMLSFSKNSKNEFFVECVEEKEAEILLQEYIPRLILSRQSNSSFIFEEEEAEAENLELNEDDFEIIDLTGNSK